MYEILRRSEERPWSAPEAAPFHAADARRHFVLRMRENRSQLTREARIGIAALAVLLMATTILPALHGLWVVPLYSLCAMAALTVALERHGRSRPASEMLELDAGRVRHRDSAGRTVEAPSFWLRLTAEQPTPAEMRLFLQGRDTSIEIGRCLSLDERRAVAPIIAAALAEARGG